MKWIILLTLIILSSRISSGERPYPERAGYYVAYQSNDVIIKHYFGLREREMPVILYEWRWIIENKELKYKRFLKL